MVPAGRSIATLAFMVPLTLACTSILGGDYRAVEVEPGGAGGLAVGGGGGATGGAGAAGGGGVGGTGGVPELSCPAGLPGPSQALVSASTQSFCIDTTEVTRSDYETFLEAGVPSQSMTGEPEECAWNASYVPTSGYPFAMRDLLEPVVFVDWCDAYAYCAWAGKRLCGALGGGTLALDAPVTSDEWHFACSGGFMTTYPYGNDPMVGACNIPNENTPEDPSDNNTKAPVGSYPACEGGLAGLFDMQGNVSEWIDRCDPGTGAGDESCSQRGGHTFGTAMYWRCNNLDESGARNDPDAREVGFRCCRDAD